MEVSKEMVEKNKVRLLDVLSFVICLVVLWTVYMNTDFKGVDDFLYHMDRLKQMLTCIEDGIYPDYYYNDYFKLGYGSSFLYPQFTLLFFVPFYFMGATALNVAMVVTCVVTHWLGFRTFAKRFSKNWCYAVPLYLGSSCFVTAMNGLDIISSFICCGLSWFFLAYFVDFMRGEGLFTKRKIAMIKASLFFFLMMGTSLISSVVGFVACVFLFILYFRKERMKEYIEFAIINLGMNAFWLCRAVWQIGICTRLDEINENMRIGATRVDCNVGFQTIVPIFGVVESTVLGGNFFNSGYSYFNIFVTIILLYFAIKYHGKLSKKEYFVLGVCLVTMVISNLKVWSIINDIVDLRIQFPIRYGFYVLGALVLIAIRNVDFDKNKLNKQLFICLCLLIIPEVFQITRCMIIRTHVIDADDMYAYLEGEKVFDWGTVDGDYKDWIEYAGSSIINGEYMDKSYTFNYSDFLHYKDTARDQNDVGYPVEYDKNVTVVDVPSHEGDLVLTIPKLWYKGFHCYDEDGNELSEVSKGYSQYCEVSIGDYSGKVYLVWNLPVILQVLKLLCFIFIVILLRLLSMLYALDKKIKTPEMLLTSDSV